ncbi:hypothetical protein TNCV_4702231 [Trichonephila clavipes]|nr:hypothetical protein TNCV_4702231 [Trichonephila clavipes]
MCTRRIFGGTGIEPRPSDPESGALTTRLPTAIFHDNARPHVARNAQEFFFTHQIELPSCIVCSPDLQPIVEVWSTLTQRLVRDTSCHRLVPRTSINWPQNTS